MTRTSTITRSRLLLFLSALLLWAAPSHQVLAVPVKVDPFFGEQTVLQLLEEGRFDQVRAMAESRLRDDPDDHEMLAILAYAQAGLDEWDDARHSVQRAIELAPVEMRGDLRVLLAEIELGDGDTTEAERILLEIIASDPNNTRAMLSAGFLYSRIGDTAQAITQFERVLSLDPHMEAALRALFQIHTSNGDYDAAARLGRQIPADSPSRWLGYFFEALALLRQDDPDFGAAIALLEESLAVSEPNAQVLFTLGHALLLQKRTEEAALRLAQAVSIAPDFFEAQRLLGVAFLQLGKPQIAVTHLEKAVAIKESPELYDLLGRAYLAFGRGEQGLGALMKSVESTDQSSDQQSSMQGIYSFASGDYEQSEAALREALQATPDAGHLSVLLVVTLLKQDRFEGAAREATQALEAHPDQSVVLLNLLGLAKIGSGAFGEAEALLRQALAEEPDSVTTHTNLSTVYFRTGQYANAERELNSILSMHPDDIGARIRLARVFRAANDFEQAERTLLAEDGGVPDPASLIRELFLLKTGQRQFDGALGYANAMVVKYPRVFEGYVLQAQALASLGRAADSREALNVGFEKAGETRGSLAAAASLARVNGWHELAVSYLRRYKARYGLDDPTLIKLFAVELIEVGRTAEARQVIQRSLAGNDPDALLLLARSHLIEGDQVRAEEYIDAAFEVGVSAEAVERQRAELSVALRMDALRDALSAEPDNATRYRDLAEAHELVGEFDAAIAVYETGIGKAGADISFKTQIARLLLKNGDAQGAIEVADTVVNTEGLADEVRIQAYAVLGMSWNQQRELQKAEKALEQATVEGSRIAPAFYELARIKSAKGDIRSAIPLLQSALEINPSSIRYYLALAALYKRLDRIEDVIAVYEQGLDANPGSAPLLNNLALVYMDQGESEKALARAMQALELAPDSARINDTLGRVYLLNEDPEQAVRYLELAVDLDPASSLYRYHLGMVYLEIGSKDLAKSELEQALERQTNAPWAPEIRRVLNEIGES